VIRWGIFKYIRYLILFFQPGRCFYCLGDKLEHTDFHHDGAYLVEHKVRCGHCGKVNAYWSYGSWDDPWPYMETFGQRFAYLFFGRY